MSDYDGNFMDMTSDWNPLSSPSIGEILAMLDQDDYGLNPISETFPQTNLATDHQSEQRSGGLGDRVAARTGFCLPPLQTESVSPLANFSRNRTLVPSPIIIISPGISLSPLLQSPNMFSSSSSHIIPPCPVANGGLPEMVESSGGAHALLMISNNNLPHQPMDVDLPPQGGGFVDIPTEESVYVTSHESNADPFGAPLVPSFGSDVAADTDIMNLMSLERGSEDDDKDKEYNQDEDEDHNFADVQDVEPSARKRRRNVVSNMIGDTRQNTTQRVIIQMESEEDYPDDGFRWRKYGRKVVRGNVTPRCYYRCTYNGCKVKKHVERKADNVKLVVATYDGIHEHLPPPERIRKSSTMVQSGSSISHNLTIPPSSSSAPQLAMTHRYMAGLSKLPSLPVNQNHGFMNRNDVPKTHRVISGGTELYKGIWERYF